jgi:hypothetical protein
VKIKTYTKGEHTYTRRGKSLEVRHETPAKTEYLFEDDLRESYSNAFSMRPGDGRFVISFYNMIPPAEKPRESIRTFLDIHTARKLRDDLERMIQESENNIPRRGE